MTFTLLHSWRASFPRVSLNFLVQVPKVSRQMRMMATIINSPRDPNTLSNYNNWRSTHVTANFDILFDQRKLTGNVVHQFKSITDRESKEIILDTNHLDISDVKVNGEPSKWELLPPLGPFGNALKISIEHGAELNATVEVDVRVSNILLILDLI